MDIDGFIKTVEIMRTVQKDYFKYRYPSLLSRVKSFENEVDREIKEYYKGRVDATQGHFFVDDH